MGTLCYLNERTLRKCARVVFENDERTAGYVHVTGDPRPHSFRTVLQMFRILHRSLDLESTNTKPFAAGDASVDAESFS